MNPLSWQKRLRPLLTPVSLLYRRILAARRAKWENEGSPAFRPVCQCVSVGNIAWGGTGKTPVVDWLLGWSEARGLRAVVLSRGYKAQPPELPLHVSPSRTPGEAGDEPLMLALEHPSAAVMVDPDRRRSGRWAEERLSPDLFVLDDGWFGNKYPRNDANAGLGDWQINAKKLPEGIDYIASHAHRKGLKFGIWIEPEMVNPKSELAEKHPDWIVRSGDREMPRMRNQWLLDLTNPKVQDFVFSVFDNTMKLSPNIDYIKWDANRHAENAGSEFLPKDRQSHFWIDYVQGFYKVMERIRAKYPDVLIQACASGGGRVEYGAMKYFNEVWTSDNTEALSRARIQYGTSLFYPATVMGSHVSATPNHQTSNITPIKFRFDMACAGRLGMELQPKQMNAEEKAFARKAIESYKGYRDIVMEGDLYRIGTPYDDTGYYGVMYVSKDKKKAVLFTYCTLYQSRTLVPKYRLYGLDAQTRYKIRE